MLVSNLLVFSVSSFSESGTEIFSWIEFRIDVFQAVVCGTVFSTIPAGLPARGLYHLVTVLPFSYLLRKPSTIWRETSDLKTQRLVCWEREKLEPGNTAVWLGFSSEKKLDFHQQLLRGVQLETPFWLVNRSSILKVWEHRWKKNSHSSLMLFFSSDIVRPFSSSRRCLGGQLLQHLPLRSKLVVYCKE